jgi:uncharacterized protein YbaA (DUF1428 family)
LFKDSSSLVPATSKDAYLKIADARIRGYTMPFDGKRIIYGGFVPILDA